jgi:hypothetical protein
MIGDDGERLLMSFFATIALRLENNKWGSRFTKIMNGLYNGKLFIKDRKEALEALNEIHTIKSEFQNLAVNKIVWNKVI